MFFFLFTKFTALPSSALILLFYCIVETFAFRVTARLNRLLDQARSQDLEKGGGGYFERVRSVQTTLTRIFMDLE